MRVAVAGGNGFIGRALTGVLTGAGHEVVWLSHRPGRAAGRTAGQGPAAEVPFDPDDDAGAWRGEIARADAVANLSGHPISSRWNGRTRALIRSTRVDLTRSLAAAIIDARERGEGPDVLVNASGAGIYGDRGDDVLSEAEPAGGDWLSRLAADWEAEAYAVRGSGVRVAAIRTGVVLGDEGALPRMALPMRLFVGGPLGSGRQWFPWIHHADIVGAYRHALESESVEGPVNAVAPEALRMREFAATLGAVLRRPSWLPVPRLVLRAVLGGVAAPALFSQRVEPEKLLSTRYGFRFPLAEGALRDALGLD